MANREIIGEGLQIGERLAADMAQRAGNLLRSAVGDELKVSSIGTFGSADRHGVGDQLKVGFSRTSAFGKPDRLAENARLETLFRERPIVYDKNIRSSEQRAGLRTGHIIDDSGTPQAVFERRLPADWRDRVEAMYRVHALSPFSNHFPVTVQTPDGRMIQERVGKSLLDQGEKFDKILFGTPVKLGQDPVSLDWLYKMHPEYHEQLQQTVAERLAVDLVDLGYHNMAMTARNGHLLMANIDAPYAFGSRWDAYIPATVPPVLGDKFTPSTFEALDNFYKFVDSKTGRMFLHGNGVEPFFVKSMSERLEGMLELGRFKKSGEW